MLPPTLVLRKLSLPGSARLDNEYSPFGRLVRDCGLLFSGHVRVVVVVNSCRIRRPVGHTLRAVPATVIAIDHVGVFDHRMHVGTPAAGPAGKPAFVERVPQPVPTVH